MDRSLIASANALFRWAETRRSEGRILDDPFATHLIDRDWRVQAIRFGRWLLPPLWKAIDELQTAHCVRHRTFDELILQAVASGIRQVVILGAGYDMRASRFQTELAGVRWFEVDRAPMLARKWRLLQAIESANRDIQPVALDLQEGSLLEALLHQGFDPSEPSCIVLEGLLHYLSRERAEALLAELAAMPAPVQVVLSFIASSMYWRGRSTATFLALIKGVKEIPDLHFHPEELGTLVERYGFGRFESWPFEAQVATFVPQAEGRRVNLSQDVARFETVKVGSLSGDPLPNQTIHER